MAPCSNCSLCSQDLEIVYSYLHGMEALSNLREHQLRSVFTYVAYLKFDITSTSASTALPNDGENHFYVNSSLEEQFHSPEMNSAHKGSCVTDM